MPNNPKVRGLEISIVIPTQGAGDRLEGCLDSLARQSLSPDRFEVHILACKNFDKTQKSAKQTDMNIYVHDLRGAGVNELRNRGWQEARGRWVFFLDDDCRLPDSNHLQERIKQHELYGIKTILGGLYLDAPKCSFWGCAYNKITSLWLQHNSLFEDRVRYLLAGNFSLHTQIRQKILLDSSLNSGGEEIAFASALSEFDYQACLLPALSVNHRAEHSFSMFVSRAISHGRAKSKLEKQSQRANIADFKRLRCYLQSPAKLGAICLYLGLMRLSSLF